MKGVDECGRPLKCLSRKTTGSGHIDVRPLLNDNSLAVIEVETQKEKRINGTG